MRRIGSWFLNSPASKTRSLAKILLPITTHSIQKVSSLGETLLSHKAPYPLLNHRGIFGNYIRSNTIKEVSCIYDIPIFQLVLSFLQCE